MGRYTKLYRPLKPSKSRRAHSDMRVKRCGVFRIITDVLCSSGVGGTSGSGMLTPLFCFFPVFPAWVFAVFVTAGAGCSENQDTCCATGDVPTHATNWGTGYQQQIGAAWCKVATNCCESACGEVLREDADQA